MKFRHIATCALLGALVGGTASADENGCATLASATHSATPQAFQVRDGEPVDLISGMKTVHGKLLVFGENGMFRAYWQPENSAEKYVLANAGENAVRLVSTPPQGTPPRTANPVRRLDPCACCPVPRFEPQSQGQSYSNDARINAPFATRRSFLPSHELKLASTALKVRPAPADIPSCVCGANVKGQEWLQ